MKRKVIILILDNIRSCENVGSIFRTADGAGVAKIYLCGITPIPAEESTLLRQGYGGQSKISKTALGAEKWVPWEYRAKTWQVLRELKSEKHAPYGNKVSRSGFKVIGLEQTKNSKNIFEFRTVVGEPLVLVVGNEVKGISPKILKYCDKIVGIPMFGKKESLNVSVAVGVALYQLAKP